MGQLKLTIATTDYDHFRDFRLGLVKAEGIDHTWLMLGHHEVFRALHRQPRIGRLPNCRSPNSRPR